MKKVEGWWLPEDDKYFGPILKTEDGFQIDRLLSALGYVDDRTIAIDGGAHVGIWSTTMVDLFDSILAFEPVPETFDCLVKNMEEVKATNVTTYNMALGDRVGFVNIGWDAKYEALGNTGSKFVVPNTSGIPMTTIDGFNLKDLGFLKLDVEGAEYLALKGAEETILKFKPVLYIECKKGYGKRFGYEDNKALDYLKSLGARIVKRIKSDYILTF